MTGRPRLLDLYCGQGGGGWGYWLAGWDVVGVDIRPQPRYPRELEFIHGDALEYLRAHGGEYDALHASPPCRAYSRARYGVQTKWVHPDLVAATRLSMAVTGRPWVIENVVGAPLVDPVMLCGTMFGLRTYRHRLFEFSVPPSLPAPAHGEHSTRVVRMGRRAGEGEYLSLVGNFSGLDEAREVMGMGWANQEGIRQAIPPAYTQWVGSQLIGAASGAELSTDPVGLTHGHHTEDHGTAQ